MNAVLSILIFATIAMFAGPSDTESITADQVAKQPAPPAPALKLVKMRPGMVVGSLPANPLFLKVNLVDDELQCFCVYGGGCGSHAITMVVTRYVFEAKRAEVDLMLTHKTRDTCEGMQASDHRFSLEPIKKAYAESAAASASLPVTLRVFGIPRTKPSKIFRYEISR